MHRRPLAARNTTNANRKPCSSVSRSFTAVKLKYFADKNHQVKSILERCWVQLTAAGNATHWEGLPFKKLQFYCSKVQFLKSKMGKFLRENLFAVSLAHLHKVFPLCFWDNFWLWLVFNCWHFQPQCNDITGRRTDCNFISR